MSQIRYLCDQIRRDEWSGILFYTSEGEFGTDEFKVKAQELYLMDIGNSTYTEYDWADPELIKYMMSNPEIRKMTKGHIHSHNKMDVFFSGTDSEELVDNSSAHNYYLSLIVNNEGDMCAKVAFRAGVRLTRTCTFKNGQGQTITKTFVDKDETECVFSYDCEITTPDMLEDGFIERFLSVKEEKTKSSFATTTYTSGGFSKKQDNDEWGAALGIPENINSGSRDSKDANSKYSSSGLLGDAGYSSIGIGKQQRSEKKSAGIDLDIHGATREQQDGGKRITLAARLVALDPRFDGLLGPLLKRVHRGFWKDPIPDRELKVETYFDSIQASASVYYRTVFTDDSLFIYYQERMERIMQSFDLYDNDYPELVKGLNDAISNSIKEVRDGRS